MIQKLCIKENVKTSRRFKTILIKIRGQMVNVQYAMLYAPQQISDVIIKLEMPT